MGAEVLNDQSCVTDWIGREGGSLPLGYFGTQPFSSLAYRKGEGCVLLNLPKMFHRIPAPSLPGETLQPFFCGAGHGPSSTDSRFPFIGVLPRGLGRGKFLLD